MSVPIRAELRAGDERLVCAASLPRDTDVGARRPDTARPVRQEIGVAIRNAELFNQVQDQNQQLRQLSEVKDDPRGVSHTCRRR